MKLRNSGIFLLTAAIIFATSCADAPKRETEEDSAATEEMEAATDETAETETMEEDDSFMLPSPIQIAAIFNRAGLKFESELTNPVSNMEKYNTKTDKYLNFGVYSADLAYAVLNDQQQLSIDYLNAVKKLTEDIGMPSIFGSGELIESFEKNVGNQDTILRILTTIKRRTDEYLEENSDKSKEAIFFSSAWVEGMYLGAKSGSKSSKITPRLVEQMTILNNVIKALKSQSDPSLDVNFMIEGLTNIQNSFEGYESIKNMEMEDVDLAEITLTEAEMKDLTQKISDLRNKIIKA